MQLTIGIIGLVVSLATASDLPVPRYMCNLKNSDGSEVGTVNFGPVTCAIKVLKEQGSFSFTDKACEPAFCVDGTIVDVCKSDGKTPGGLQFPDISHYIEKTYEACGGVPTNTDNGLKEPHDSAAGVSHRPFQYIGDGFSIAVRGADCNAAGSNLKGYYKVCPYMH